MGSVGAGRGTGGLSGNTLAARLDRTPFKDEGGGQWTLDTGMGGGTVLDETGTSRDPGMGFGGKVYSAMAWDSNYDPIGETQFFSTLAAAKSSIKERIKSTL